MAFPQVVLTGAVQTYVYIISLNLVTGKIGLDFLPLGMPLSQMALMSAETHKLSSSTPWLVLVHSEQKGRKQCCWLNHHSESTGPVLIMGHPRLDRGA